MIIDPNLRDMILFIFHHIHNLNSGSGGGNVTTSQLNTALDSKIDKVAGKGLSTNDYTTADKNKVNLIDSKLDKGTYNGTAQDLKNAIDILDNKTVSWNDIQNKPNFNYLPLTGGTVNGDVTADSIIKKNSSNDKVLLGGGGEKSLSELDNKNIQVGGRNYLLNSKQTLITSSASAITNVIDISPDFKKILSEQPTASFVISCFIKYTNLRSISPKGRLGFEGVIEYIDGTLQYINYWLNVLNSDVGKSINGERFYKSITLLPDKTVKNIKISGIFVQISADQAEVSNPKIEFGNKPTDWTPAPEDYEFIKPGFLVSELNTFKKRETGGYYVSFGGGTGILLSFEGGGSTSSLEFYKANWYPETRIQVRNTVDGSRFNDDNGGFRELAWFSDLYKPGATITGDWLAEKAYQNNTIFVQNPCNIELSELDNFGSVSFRKVFASGDITFSFHGKTIIYTSSNTFNGGEGSTATVSIFYNKCYIDIKNV